MNSSFITSKPGRALEYQVSALQFELSGHPTLTTEDWEEPSIVEDYLHTDSLVSTNNVTNISDSLENF